MSQSDTRSASQIEREVEASRANLEDTVEALKDKMSVGQMVDEASRYFGDSGGGEMLSRLGEQARANPLPLVLVGVGLAWLMSGRGQPHLASRRTYRERDRGDYDYESLGDDEYRRAFGQSAVYSGSSHPDYASPDYSGQVEGEDGSWRSGEAGSSDGRLGRVRRAAHTTGSAVSGAASGIGSAVSGIAGAVGSVASGLGHAASRIGGSAYSTAGSAAGGARSGAGAAWRGGYSAYRGASHVGSGAYRSASRFGGTARRGFSDVLETEPLVLGALGLAVGAAIGALLPGTETEDRYMGETRDRLRDDAETYARDKFEQGKSVAEEAYRTAKEEAEAQGLTSSGEDSIVGRVGSVARATMERARESAAEKGLSGSGSENDAGGRSTGALGQGAARTV